jgi:tape measure domain-containing protein
MSKPIQAIARNAEAMGGQARRTQSMFGSLGGTMMKFAGAYIGITQAITQTKAFVNLGIEIEQTRAKFETLTGSLERGNNLIDKLGELAKKSPFSSAQFAKQAELLLAFGIEADKVTKYLSMLGDIAMGDENKLSGLSLAFAQMSSTGRLTGQDLLQMINQGFNPLAEISRKTGKSLSVLRDEMAKGKISAQMVIDAFRDATSEGGKFYGMSEKIAQTAGGKFSSAFGVLRDKLMRMAEQIMPYVNRIADAFLSFARHFETFASIVWGALMPVRVLVTGLITIAKYLAQNSIALAAVTTAFIAYRIALWKATLALKGWTIASILQHKWLLLVEKAQKLLNTTILKNPVMALLVGVSLLVGALVTMRRRAQEASDTLSRLNKTAGGYAAEEKSRLDVLFDRLKQTNPKSKERNELVKQLNELYPDVLKNMNLEKASLDQLEIAYNAIVVAIERKARARAYEEELVELYKQKDEIEKTMEDNPMSRRAWYNRIKDFLNDMVYDVVAPGYKKVSQEERESEERVNIALDELAPTEEAIGRIKALLAELQKEEISGTYTRAFPNGGINNNNTSVSSLTGSGAKPTNVNITFKNLIEYLQMYPQTLPEGVNQVENELIEGLLRVVNSANRISER